MQARNKAREHGIQEEETASKDIHVNCTSKGTIYSAKGLMYRFTGNNIPASLALLELRSPRGK